jgi:hypothetical protein
MKEFDVNKKIKKISRPELLAIFLIILGVILLFLERWVTINSFRDLTKILDSLLFPILGIVILINSSKQIKKIRGSYLKLDLKTFSFKSRSVEKEIRDLSEVKDIKITLETIKITDNSKNEYTIFLNDYIKEGEQREIKEYFKEVAVKVNSNKLVS